MFIFNKNYEDLEQVKEFYPDFLREYQSLKAKNQYPYNSLFEGKIKGLEESTEHNEKTGIYLLQRLQEKTEKETRERKMTDDGWVKLTEEIIKTAFEKKKKIMLLAKTTNNWAISKVEKKLKPHFFGGSIQRWGLMELKAKTRGYSISQFDEPFCKLV